MRKSTTTDHANHADSSPDLAPDVDAGVDAIADALAADNLPDREVIAPERDAYGRWMPAFRLWMQNGYTLLTRARTPGEACSKAIDDARAMIERTGQGRRMTPRERRLATTVDCWRQVG